MVEHPPQCSLVFHVGVTGESDGLGPEVLPGLERSLRRILCDVNEIISSMRRGSMYCTDVLPTCRLISCLEAGSERLAACVALNEDFRLQCCLLSCRENCAVRSSSEASRAEFEDLLQSAESVFEITLEASSEQARLDAGLVMMGHSDILLAVWNGESSSRIGDTADLVERARTVGIPIIRIKPSEPDDVVILHDAGEKAYGRPLLTQIVAKLLWDREKGSGGKPAEGQTKYYKETPFSWNGWILYKLLLRLLSPQGGKPSVSMKAVPFERRAREELYRAGAQDGKNDDEDETRRRILLSHFGWADSLAISYADKYRSAAFLRNIFFLSATFSLGMGFYHGKLWGQGEGYFNGIGFVLQMAFLLGIFGLVRLNSMKEWHRKFMDYRILAEMIRLARYLHPLGIAFRGVKVPDYYGDMFSWVNWQFRGIVRSLGLPNVTLDQASQLRYLGALSEAIEGQIGFHQAGRERYASAARRLHKTWSVLLWAGIAAVGLRVLIQCFPLRAAVTLGTDPLLLKNWFNALALILPAAAGFVYSTLSQLGFEKLHERSKAMAERLNEFRSRIKQLTEEIRSGQNVPYSEIRALAYSSYRVMLEEVTDWRIFVTSKSIPYP